MFGARYVKMMNELIERNFIVLAFDKNTPILSQDLARGSRSEVIDSIRCCLDWSVSKKEEFVLFYTNFALWLSKQTFAFFLQSNFGTHGFPDNEKIIDDIAEVMSGVKEIIPPSSQTSESPKPVKIEHEEILSSYIGEYKNLALDCTYRIETKEQEGSWILCMRLINEAQDREIMDFNPHKALDDSLVFFESCGGSLELVDDGLVLKGAGIAPWHLTKVS